MKWFLFSVLTLSSTLSAATVGITGSEHLKGVVSDALGEISDP